MDKVFKSKIDWWYHMLIWMIILLSVVAVLGQNIVLIAGTLITAMAVLHVFFNTYYVVTAEGLLVTHCGFFPVKTIPIAEIEALESSIFPGFSYALSLDRISIWQNGQIWMLVSPKNQKEFIQALRGHNPSIKVRSNSTLL